MTRIFVTFLICSLTACNNSVIKNENRLAKEMSAFLISGEYDVQIVEGDTNSISTNPIKGQLTLTNNLGLIEFRGKDSFSDLDSISISMTDSTLLRQYLINHFLDTILVSADNSGFNEAYYGYVFGNDNSGGIANIPEFRHLFNKENISGSQFMFIIGRFKNHKSIVIKRIERIVESGRIILNMDKTYILTDNYLRRYK
jgi:hypothetical protein